MSKLSEAMQKVVYSCTDVVLDEILTVSGGEVGFLITYGAWYKLRIWKLKSNQSGQNCSVVYSAQFATQAGAIDCYENKKCYYQQNGI